MNNENISIEAQIAELDQLIDAMQLVEQGIAWKFDALAEAVVGAEEIDPEILQRAKSVLRRASLRQPAGFEAYLRIRGLRVLSEEGYREE